MNKRKILGRIIIGVAITLAVAFLALLIRGTDQIIDNYNPNWSLPVIQQRFEGDSLFLDILFVGLFIVTIITLKDFKKSLKSIFYPTSIGVIIGIILGIFIPSSADSTRFYIFLEFNWTLFFVISGIGVFISLIALGINLLKDK